MLIKINKNKYCEDIFDKKFFDLLKDKKQIDNFYIFLSLINHV